MSDNGKPSTLRLITVGIFLIGVLVFLFTTPKPKAVVYDCSLAEISPDYPLEVKEQCRQLRAKNFQEDLKKPK